MSNPTCSPMSGPPPLGAGSATPNSGEPPPRPSRAERLRQFELRNRRIRERNRWNSRVVALIPEMRRTHGPIAHEVNGRNIAEALELAIEDVCRRMRPLSPEEKQDAENRGYWLPPLTDDVALAIGGRIAAVVFAVPDGPEVIRFGPFGGVEALIDAANGRSERKRYRPAGGAAPEVR